MMIISQKFMTNIPELILRVRKLKILQPLLERELLNVDKKAIFLEKLSVRNLHSL